MGISAISRAPAASFPGAASVPVRLPAWRMILSAPRAARAAVVRHAVAVALVASAIAACAHAATGPEAPGGTALDAATAERILALDPESISEQDVREVLTRAPAPRI